MSKTPKILKVHEKQDVVYCIPMWQRNLQIRYAISRIKDRVEPYPGKRADPVAVVCFGPSLLDTWEKVRDYRYVISCSGSHKFLSERGIIPNWHVEVDPRPHKVKLIGQPNRETEYWISSTCHKAVFDHLEGYNVKLWHVFDGDEQSSRVIPQGEWCLTGGCGVGLRALTCATFLGFRDIHIFGMDGCEGKDGRQHAGDHPNESNESSLVEYPEGSGVWYRTTSSKLEEARTTFHELDQLPSAKFTFYGEGLVQAMARDWIPRKQKGVLTDVDGIQKAICISEYHRELNSRLHDDNVLYGAGGYRHAEVVKNLVKATKAESVLDYGCGKGTLAESLPFPIWEYDPALPGKSELPRPADLVVCTDVLEHVEPEFLQNVLAHLASLVRKVGYFVIHVGPAQKTYADGRNTHLIQQNKVWWSEMIGRYFTIGQIFEIGGKELHIIVGPRAIQERSSVLVHSVFDFIDFQRMQVYEDPFVHGVIENAVPDELYIKMVSEYPNESLFKYMGGHYNKYSLSEVNNPDQYYSFIKSSTVWSQVYQYVKKRLVGDVLRYLSEKGLPLPSGKLVSRFEFSSLPAMGGKIDPHTDIKSKVVTLILSMRNPSDDWDSSWGGGTDILRPVDPAKELQDYEAPLSEFERVRTFDYVPNQCVFFVKNDKSWHSAGPFAGPHGPMRRTITINIESVHEC